MGLFGRLKRRIARRKLSASSARSYQTTFLVHAILTSTVMVVGGFAVADFLGGRIAGARVAEHQAVSASAFAPLLVEPLRRGDRVQAARILLALAKDHELLGARLVLPDGTSFAAAGADTQAGPADLRRVTPVVERVGGLELYYQPKINLRTGEPVGLEALVRWIRPHGKVVSPGEWLSVAEDRGLMVPVSDYLVRRAVSDVGQWSKLGLDPRVVAINVNPVQMQNLDHIERMIDQLAASSVPAEKFMLEITEGCVVGHHSDAAMTILTRMRHKGLSLSLDDFGTGYASLTHLKELPVNEIKIDCSFTRGVGRNPGDEAIIQTIVQLARKMGLRVVAEGIETPEQYRFLRDCGCTAGQGFLLSRPLSLEQTTAFLTRLSGRRTAPAPAPAQLRKAS